MEFAPKSAMIQPSPGDPDSEIEFFKIGNIAPFDQLLAFKYSSRRRRPAASAHAFLAAFVVKVLKGIGSWRGHCKNLGA